MSNLVEHARRELELLGQFKEDPIFAQSIVAAVAAFDSYPGHSGSSAEIATEMLYDLLQLKNLTPLTDNPDEWEKQLIDPEAWQNRRNGAAFSQDGGKTFYLVTDPRNDDGSLPVYHSATGTLDI